MTRDSIDSDRPTVLVVDDEAAFRELLEHRLGEEGWDVMQASTMAEAFPLFEEKLPSVVVLDHAMPGMTGIEAARVLVRAGLPAPIVLFSAYLTAELRQECRMLGIHPVDKINWEELFLTCHELLDAAPAPLRM